MVIMDTNFDFNAFLHRKKLKHREAAPGIGVSQSLVSSWAANRAVPSYDSLCKLIEAGMTADELFGKELAAKLIANSATEAKQPSNDDLKAAFKEFMRDLVSDSNSPKP